MPDPGPVVAPPRWALSPWARFLRRPAHWWFVGRQVRRFCSPLKLDGMENLADVKTPAIFVANHTSHFDAYLVSSVLPPRLRYRAAMAAAADRWYARKKLRAAWFSLLVNIYPIQRGGGRAALTYSEWLLERGWSLIIFPEGTRAKRGHMEAFKYGVAILALGQRVPVVPIHLAGTAGILPPGERWVRRAPVSVRIGAPLTFEPDTPLQEAVVRLEEVVRMTAGVPEGAAILSSTGAYPPGADLQAAGPETG